MTEAATAVTAAAAVTEELQIYQTIIPKNDKVVDSSSFPRQRLNKKESSRCEEMLSQAAMFLKVKPRHREMIVNKMYKHTLRKNETLINQDDTIDRFFLVESGEIRRTRIDEGKKEHNVMYPLTTKTIGSMRVIEGDPSYSTVTCDSPQGCTLYGMMRHDLLGLLHRSPEMTIDIANGLSQELRAGNRKFETPLLQQKEPSGVALNDSAVAIAAGTESYYRSILNAILIARLSGGKRGDLLPNMHIQVPVRIAYVTGFKGLRKYLEESPLLAKAEDEHRTLVGLTRAVSPGIIMTPISSVLEASNAGHMNPESMWTRRWMRGIVPRAGREIIFGIGLNQLSDYFEERLLQTSNIIGTNNNKMMANAMGSLAAGAVAGYFSHIPHNLSTLKLLEPHKSYPMLYQKFVDSSVPPFVESMVKPWSSSPIARSFTRILFATICPRGVMIRTVQIVGSFMILNGTINTLQ